MQNMVLKMTNLLEQIEIIVSNTVNHIDYSENNTKLYKFEDETQFISGSVYYYFDYLVCATYLLDRLTANFLYDKGDDNILNDYQIDKIEELSYICSVFTIKYCEVEAEYHEDSEGIILKKCFSKKNDNNLNKGLNYMLLNYLHQINSFKYKERDKSAEYLSFDDIVLVNGGIILK